MEAYFDNSATTKALDSVRDIMVKTLMEDFGNPSAKHTKGMEAEKYIRQAAADIAKTLKVKDKEILFTSGVQSLITWHLLVRPWQTREQESILSAPGSSMPLCISRWHFWSP